MGDREEVEVWAASGALALTGPADGAALGPPAGLVPRLLSLGERIRTLSAVLGRRVEPDPVALLSERARAGALARQGRVSCGGATRLMESADGWVAVSLPRPDDWDLVPAWLGRPVVSGDWDALADIVGRTPAARATVDGAALGLAVATLGETLPSGSVPGLDQLGDGPSGGSLDEVLVVDLSALWAGPLCTSVLADAGAHVVKVESSCRPDGARRGPPAFFDLLNAGKESVAIDFRSARGRRALRALVHRADVVVEGSRPRALRQLGVDADGAVRDHRPRVWLSITGHGRGPAVEHRIGFGDDAAVAGGLVSWNGKTPDFCADAVADPLTGMTAAATCLDLLASGGSWMVDLALARIAADASGPTLPVPDDLTRAVPPPTPPTRCRGVAATMGADTERVLAQPKWPHRAS